MGVVEGAPGQLLAIGAQQLPAVGIVIPALVQVGDADLEAVAAVLRLLDPGVNHVGLAGQGQGRGEQ